MSGIFGLYHRNQQGIDQDVLARMGTSTRHRGPDGINTWSERNIGIGHCHFHTTPEAVGEILPYEDQASGLVISADARIDARKELAVKLGLRNRLKEGIPDSQLILAAYRKWQTECVHYLIGDFAFLIWDKTRQRLFCARDHLGVKPFYYYLSDQVFAVASETRALIQIPRVPREVNEGRIADFLVGQLQGYDKVSTFYRSIYRLPPAHTMLVSRDKVTIREYWQPDAEAETHLSSDSEYIETFQEIFKDAVRDRLRCHGQPSSMLSGGIDSSYIVGTARQINREDGAPLLPVYSGITQNDPQCRETRMIQAVIKQGGFESITASPDQVADYKTKLLNIDDSIEDPFDSSMTMIKLLYLMARDRGQRVMLDGVEGDLVHSLSQSYPARLVRDGHYRRAFSESIGIWRNTYRKEASLFEVFNNTIRPAFIPHRLRRWRRHIRRRSMLEESLSGTVISRDFAREVDIEGRLGKLASHSDAGANASLRERQARNILHPYLTTALERYDRIAALCGIEPRHPLLDKRLVEFSLSLPWDMKVRHGWSKYILRRASESLVPAEVAWRQGWDDIGWQFTSALIQLDSERLTQASRRHELLSRYVQADSLKSLASDRPIDASSDREEAVWMVAQLARWLNLYAREGLNHYA